jgi:tetratricopeptide (TPR) repeat protein
VFESPQAAEVKLTGEQVKSWVVEKIVPHGTVVEAKQNLVWFKTDAIDKQIRDAEIELTLARLGLDDAKFKFDQFLETQALDRGTAERAMKRAVQDFDHYVKVDRDYQLKSANFNLKLSEYALENVQEELNQLEKMYRQDELTEESEEIVLKRAQRDVESALFRLEGTRSQHRRTVDETLPRNEAEQHERLRRAEMAHQAAMKDLELARVRRELELQKQQIKFDEQLENFEKLKAERKNAVLQAPVAGVVLHGALNRGALPERSTTLEPGKSITVDQVVVTVSPTQPLHVRLTVNEADFRHLSVGMEVTVIANLFPNSKMLGKVESLSAVPFSGSKFDCLVSFAAGELAAQLIPTTGCRVEFANTDPAPVPENADKAIETENQDTAGGEQGDGQGQSQSEMAGGEDKTEAEGQAGQTTEVPRDDPLTGTWSGSVSAFDQELTTFEMVLQLAADDSVTGTLSSEGESLALESGKYQRESKKLVFRVNTPIGPMEPEFELVDKTLTAKVTTDEGLEITLRAVKR